VLSHNELELALDALEHAGCLVATHGGFWRDLDRAAKNMGSLNVHLNFAEDLKKRES
jgi:hypothetical protein